MLQTLVVADVVGQHWQHHSMLRGDEKEREEREISGRSEKEVERDGKREGRESMA